MKKLILATMFFLVMVGNALAVPWVTTTTSGNGMFGQIDLQPFNLIEGFRTVGQHFSAASPADNVNFNGIGNFSDSSWHGDMPNNHYVRAWGNATNFLLWDVALDGVANTIGSFDTNITWFFYNCPDIGVNPPAGQLHELTYKAAFTNGAWQINSMSTQPTIGSLPNMWVSDNSLRNIDSSTWDRPGWTVPVDPSAPVPEPGTVVLLGAGLASLVVYKRRQNKVVSF